MTLGKASLTEKPRGASLAAVSNARAFVTLGCSSKGALNTPAATGTPKGTVDGFGCGPAVRAHCYKQAKTGAEGLFVRVKATARAASKSAVDVASWAGTSVPTLTGTPNAAYDVRVKATTGGTVGSSGIFTAISYNGGDFSTPAALGTATTLAIGTTGLTLNFAAGTITTGAIAAFWTRPASAAILPETVTRANSGTPSTGDFSVGGSPEDDYEVIFEILTGGTSDGTNVTGEARYSLDNEVNWTSITLSEASITLLDGADDSGLTMLLDTGTYDAGDKIAFSTTAPEFATSDAVTALAQLRASKFAWSWVHAAQALDTASAGTLGSTVASWATKNKFSFVLADARPQGLGETRSGYISRLVAQWAGFADSRIALGAGMARITDPITGRRNRRPVSWIAGPRIVQIPPQRDLAQKEGGTLSSDVAIHDEAGILTEYDADENSALDAARFITLRTYTDEPGVYFASGSVMGGPDDTERLADRRVLNAVAEVYQRSLLSLVKKGFDRNGPGVKAPLVAGDIAEHYAKAWETTIRAALKKAIVAAGMATDIQVQIVRTPVTIGSGKWKIMSKVKVFGRAYVA